MVVEQLHLMYAQQGDSLVDHLKEKEKDWLDLSDRLQRSRPAAVVNVDEAIKTGPLITTTGNILIAKSKTFRRIMAVSSFSAVSWAHKSLQSGFPEFWQSLWRIWMRLLPKNPCSKTTWVTDNSLRRDVDVSLKNIVLNHSKTFWDFCLFSHHLSASIVEFVVIKEG